ncbi:hypothetical protein GOP47_0009238 [Adiantum capillus-veneris]|uniref:Uncharacterized protein n=1 Tax=Adiantum capillus-veneris TaxID=13818 RepID=A0A9D4UXF2_ADICA|nr:hypothetical protein GOP47_0009238 [Adiantum capillus-veneris]
MAPRSYSEKLASKDRGNLFLHALGGDALNMESGEDELVGSVWSVAAWLVSVPPAPELPTTHLGKDNILPTATIAVLLVFSFILQEGTLTLGSPN